MPHGIYFPSGHQLQGPQDHTDLVAWMNNQSGLGLFLGNSLRESSWNSNSPHLTHRNPRPSPSPHSQRTPRVRSESVAFLQPAVRDRCALASGTRGSFPITWIRGCLQCKAYVARIGPRTCASASFRYPLQICIGIVDL